MPVQRNALWRRTLSLTLCIPQVCFVSFSQSDDAHVSTWTLHDELTLGDFAEVQVKWSMSGESQAFLNEGLNELREERYEAALDQLTRALDTDKSATVAYYYRAMARKQLILANLTARAALGLITPEFKEAITDVEAFLDAHPGDKEGLLELGKLQLLNLDARRGIKLLERFTDKFPNDARGPYFLGFAYLAMQDGKRGKEMFIKCLDVDPKFTSGLMQLAVREDKSEAGKKKAEAYFDQILEIDSMQRSARILRFFFLNERKQKEEAMRDINFLVRYDQSNWKLKLYRAYVLIDMKEYDKAFNDMRPALEATHVSESNFVGKQTSVDRRIDIQNAGNYLLRHLYGLTDEDASSLRMIFCMMIIGDYQQARTVLNERKQLSKYAVSAYFLGVCLEHEEHFLLARTAYRDALNLDPEIFDANKKCGIIYTSEGKWRQSLPYFDAMEKLNPAYAQTYNLRGVVHYSLANYPKAIADFTRFLESDTSNLEVYYNRGMSQQRLGNDLLALADMIKSKEFASIDFAALHKKLDGYFLTGDTTTLRLYGAEVMKVPSQSGHGVDLEVMKVKLMQLERNWVFINDRYKRLVIQKSIGDNPGYISSTLAAKAAQHLEVGELDEAESLLTKSIKYNQQNWVAYLERGIVYLRRNEKEKGLEDLKEAASLGDKHAAALLEREQKN